MADFQIRLCLSPVEQTRLLFVLNGAGIKHVRPNFKHQVALTAINSGIFFKYLANLFLNDILNI